MNTYLLVATSDISIRGLIFISRQHSFSRISKDYLRLYFNHLSFSICVYLKYQSNCLNKPFLLFYYILTYYYSFAYWYRKYKFQGTGQSNRFSWKFTLTPLPTNTPLPCTPSLLYLLDLGLNPGSIVSQCWRVNKLCPCDVSIEQLLEAQFLLKEACP